LNRSYAQSIYTVVTVLKSL